MHQTQKGNQWHFGMKMHIGVDDSVGLVHSVETTSANIHDITMAKQLLHGDEKRAWEDAGYLGVEKREEHSGSDAKWFVSCRPGKRKNMAAGSDESEMETTKAQVRAKVERQFLYIKRIFNYGKVRYRGLSKNKNRLFVLAGFYNLIRYDQLLA